MWHTTDFENKLKECLVTKLGTERGNSKYIEYASLRDSMIQDGALSGIKVSEPGLTDHSESHISDVMSRVYKLLGESPEKWLTHSEFYILALMILFHDAGNIYGRTNHEENAAKVYGYFKGQNQNRQERLLLIKGVAAHSGFGSNGTKDTLKDLDNVASLNGDRIRLQELAALLRFGDELAEGPQRTSEFMLDQDLIKEESVIYHQYAKITDIFIDRNLERVSLTYHIDIDKDNFSKNELEELLEFIYGRIFKLDVERRYNKNYSELLQPFKKTAAEINFYMNGCLLNEIEVSKLELLDRFPVPNSENIDNLSEISNHFSSEKIIAQIQSLIS